jgi:hypothetical protein
MLVALANADGLIRRRPNAPPAPKGTLIDVIVFDHLGISDGRVCSLLGRLELTLR